MKFMTFEMHVKLLKRAHKYRKKKINNERKTNFKILLFKRTT